MEIFNTHTHINAAEFAYVRPQLLQRAQALGVTQMLVVAYDAASWQTLTALAAANPHVYGAFGCHPENAALYQDTYAKPLQQHLTAPFVKAVGEIGLDYHCDVDKKLQWQVFEAQLQVAAAHKLPVVIHNRDAFADTLAILKNADLSAGCIMHSFNGDENWARQFLDAGCYLSYSGVVTFSNATDVLAGMMATPLDRMLVETDDPYLAPQPFRNNINEPGLVRYVVEFIARHRNLSAAQVAQVTTKNAERILQIETRPND